MATYVKVILLIIGCCGVIILAIGTLALIIIKLPFGYMKGTGAKK